MKRISGLLFLLLKIQISFAQGIDIKEYAYEYSLPPVDGSPLTISQNLSTFQYRAFGKNTQYIPAEYKPNFLGEKEIYIYVKGWKQVKSNPQFYIDFIYSAPVIIEEIVIDQKKEYAVNPPYSEKVYRFKYMVKVETKLLKPDGTVLYEITFPEEELNYDFTEAEAARLGYKSVTGSGFQNEVALLDAAKIYRNTLLENLEYNGAKHFTIDSQSFKNNLHNFFYFKLFPFEGKEVTELATFNNLKETTLSDLKLEEANKLALEYYSSLQTNYMNWLEKKDLIINAIKIWTDAISYINTLDKLPLHKEMLDACAYNMSVGLAYLNAFETSEMAIKLLNTEGNYGIGLGKTNRYENMLVRARYVINEFIPHKRNVAKIRGWKKVEF